LAGEPIERNSPSNRFGSKGGFESPFKERCRESHRKGGTLFSPKQKFSAIMKDEQLFQASVENVRHSGISEVSLREEGGGHYPLEERRRPSLPQTRELHLFRRCDSFGRGYILWIPPIASAHIIWGR